MLYQLWIWAPFLQIPVKFSLRGLFMEEVDVHRDLWLHSSLLIDKRRLLPISFPSPLIQILSDQLKTVDYGFQVPYWHQYRFTLIFDQYVASIGPGVAITENRKNCQLNIDLQYPQGFQYSVFTTDYRGYVGIDAGVTATQEATYYFSGRKFLPFLPSKS